MIQPILFFVLGALSLLLLVLLAAPGFRRSAERSARRKLEARLPMSLNEIEAGKDALRAEFATVTRRFEHDARTLRTERNEQAVAVGRALEEARTLQESGEALRAAIAGLEGERDLLRSRLAAADETAKGAETQLAAQEKLMDESRSETNRLEKRFEEASFLASSRQIDLVGRESEIERLDEELRAARDHAGALERELNAVRSAADANRSRAGDATAKAESLSGELSSAEERFARGRAEADRLRREWETAQTVVQRQEAELIEAHKERMDLELEFAALNRLVVSLFPGAAAGGDPARALESAAAERDRLESRIAALLRETRDLRSALGQHENGSSGTSTDTSADAVLREQMLQLAARVTVLAARFEGPGSPIEAALGSGQTDPGAPRPSLADRIRALAQETSSFPAK